MNICMCLYPYLLISIDMNTKKSYSNANMYKYVLESIEHTRVSIDVKFEGSLVD